MYHKTVFEYAAEPPSLLEGASQRGRGALLQNGIER